MQPSVATVVAGPRSCAYCNAVSGLTREHVFSKFIDSRDAKQGRKPSLTNVRAGSDEKVVSGEVTIADVCSKCNNGFLSELDNYGAQLYDTFFDISPRPGKQVRFACEYGRLLRWLLKLAYNAGRARKWPHHLLQPIIHTVPYIMGNDPRPVSLDLFLQLVTPTPLVGTTKKRVEERLGKTFLEIPPDVRRIAVFEQQGLQAGYIVAMNGYVFYLLFRNPKNSSVDNRSTERCFYKENRGATKIHPTATKAVIYPSSLSIMDVVRSNPILKSNIGRGAKRVDARSNVGLKVRHTTD